MVRRRVLGVQQPRGYSVRTTNSSLSFEALGVFSPFFLQSLMILTKILRFSFEMENKVANHMPNAIYQLF